MIVYYGNLDVTNKLLSFTKKADFIEGYFLGQTPIEEVTIELNNADGTFNESNQLITIFDDSIKLGTYTIYEKPEKYTSKLKLVLYDNMYRLKAPYRTELTYPCLIGDQLDEIAALSDVTINYSNLPTTVLNTSINWWDNTVSMIDYISWISEIAGMNAYANEDGVICFRQLDTTPSYQTSFVSTYEKNELFVVSRVCFDDGLVKYESGTEVANTLYVRNTNPYINNQEQIDYLFSLYNGLSFYGIEKLKMKGIETLKCGDMINYNDEFLFLATSISTKYYGGEYSIQIIDSNVYSKNEEVVINRYDNSIRIKRIQTIVDQNDASMKILAQDVEDNKNKIGNLEVSAEKISSKVTSTVEDVESLKNRVHTAEQKITDEAIVQTVTSSETYIDDMGNKVSTDEIISQINQSAELIKILAPKISLEGLVTVNGNFKVLEDGTVEAVDGKFSGQIESSEFYSSKEYVTTYTAEDRERMLQIYFEEVEPTQEDWNRLDINLDGRITSYDSTIVNAIVSGNWGNPNNPGLAEIEDYISINVQKSHCIEIGRIINGIEVSKNLVRPGGFNINGGSGTVDGEEILTSLMNSGAYFL